MYIYTDTQVNKQFDMVHLIKCLFAVCTKALKVTLCHVYYKTLFYLTCDVYLFFKDISCFFLFFFFFFFFLSKVF